MEDWSGGGPDGGTRFLDFNEAPTEVVICIFIHINKNIHFSSIARVIINIFIHGCNYFGYVLCHVPDFAFGQNGLITFAIFTRVCQIDAKGQIIDKEENY